MKLIDTHTHLYVEDFKDDIEEVMERAAKQGVEKFYLPAIDRAETKALLSLEKKYPGMVHAMAGLHPCSVKENYKEELGEIKQQLTKRNFAAIGETGLDFYWDTSFKAQQYESLQVHIQWALDYNRPIVLHTRNAMRETIDMIAGYKNTPLRGIFHCFSGTLEEANEITCLGFLLGIGGVITYKNSGLAEIIKEVDLKYLVLETDAPYLSPVPFRGKRNESSYLIYIAQKVADVKNITLEEVAKATSLNAVAIFQ